VGAEGCGRVTGAALDAMVAACDPGIRGIVHDLNLAGFETSDSGDGVTKPQEVGETLPFPHVAVATTPATMVADADRLLSFLRGHDEMGDGFVIESTYSPEDRCAVILASWP
jgi:hypothetical protein